MKKLFCLLLVLAMAVSVTVLPASASGEASGEILSGTDAAALIDAQGNLSLTDPEEDYVYITPEGEAYHLSTDCNYLKLSIESVKYSELAALRNDSDHKYYPCSICAEENTSCDNVYITSYGEYFHTDLNCLGLKRTIYMVPLSEVGNRHLCSKCDEGD